MGFPHSSVGNESAFNAGDQRSIPGSGRPSGEGNGNPILYFCLENSLDRGAWRATVHEIERAGHNLATKPPPTPQVLFNVLLLSDSTTCVENKSN